MALHRLTRLTIGVPNLDETAAFYTDFGLIPIETADGEAVRRFATVDGGEQLRLVHRPIRQLVEIGIGAGDADDLGRIKAALSRIDVDSKVKDDDLHVVEPATGIAVTVSVVGELAQKFVQAEQNFPGRYSAPQRQGAGTVSRRAGAAQKAGPRGVRFDGLRGFKTILHGRPRLQDQRRGRRHRGLHAVLTRPSQRAGAGGAGEFPAPHVLGGRGFRRDRAGRTHHARRPSGAPRMGNRPALDRVKTSSTIFVTRQATCRSTTPTWTKYSTTRSGSRHLGHRQRAQSTGDRPCHRR